MPGPLILDSSAFVSLVDRRQRRHAECTAIFNEWPARVATTEAVLTETLYLVGPGWHRQKPCLEFLFRGALLLVPSSRISLHRAAALMQQYENVPMDFADATLVALAEELRVNQVFTLDRRGFLIYRLYGKSPIDVLP